MLRLPSDIVVWPCALNTTQAENPGGSLSGVFVYHGPVPFKSEKQRRFMHMAHPDIAHAWEHGRSSVTGKKERGKRKKKGRR